MWHESHRMWQTRHREGFSKKLDLQKSLFCRSNQRTPMTRARDVFAASAEGNVPTCGYSDQDRTMTGVPSLGCSEDEGPNSPVVRWLAEELLACATSSDFRCRPCWG